MTYSKTQSTNKTEWMGDFKVRVFELDITNYDDDGNGDGEAFGPADAQMDRFLAGKPLDVDVVGAGTANNTFEGSVAIYDKSAGAVRLYVSGGTDGNALSELASNGNNGARVQVTCVGR